MNDETEHARNQAQAQMNSIREMVTALELDYDRLEELREQYATEPDGYRVDRQANGAWMWQTVEGAPTDTWAEYDTARAAIIAAWADSEPEYDHTADAEELAELETEAGENNDRDDAEQRIHEDALSVETRTDWAPLGDTGGPHEFRIVLCTGGPHVQIRGQLDDHGEPCRAWLEYQDWGTPMTERVNDDGDQDALLTYARCFYFGE